jgi:hypothetical protein
VVFGEGQAFRVAERHEKVLYLVDNEPASRMAGSAVPGFNHYQIDAAPHWKCPWCGAREGDQDFLRLFWTCSEAGCGNPIHCAGNRRGKFLCACGQRARRTFSRADVFPVYEYDGVRGPSGRGHVRSCVNADGTISYWSLRGLSCGSLVRTNALVRR